MLVRLLPFIQMSRHNRRRIRGGHRASRASFQHDNFQIPSLDPNDCTSLAPPLQALASRGDLNAKHWHNRYIAWQNRDRKKKEERQRLREDRNRIFGGNSDEGDDEGLCYKMLEYFTGLDYIEA